MTALAVIIGMAAGAWPPAQAAATTTATDWTVVEGADLSAQTGVAGSREIRLSRATAAPNAIALRQVPVPDGGKADFQLESFDVFTPEARIVAATDRGDVAVARPTVKLYQGRSADGDGDMFLAVDGETMQGVIRHGGKTQYLLPMEGRKHVVTPGTAMPSPVASEFCSADYLPENLQKLSQWSEQEMAARSMSVTGPLRESDFMIDVNQSLTARLGGPTGAATYMAVLMGAVSAIYRRDVNARMRISSLTLWTTATPFGGSTSLAQLQQYQSWCNANRTGVSRDLAHLFADGNVTNYGGIAYLGVLCHGTYGYGVSNIRGTVSFPTPSYHWDIDVTAHEIGHNYGSPHTHCYSPPIDQCYNGENGCYTGSSVATLGTIMSYCHLTSGGKSLVFSQREIDVIRGGIDGASCFTTQVNTPRDTVGAYTTSTSRFFLRNQHLGGVADVTAGFGPAGSGWTPVSGDWNGDGRDTIGLYNPATATFFLKNANAGGSADLTFRFGPANAGYRPIVGDWNGDGIDTIGVYNPATGTFFLKNSNVGGSADRTFSFGSSNLRPVAGDWNGDGIDTVGVYNPATGTFFFRNVHSSGVADATFRFGPSGQSWVPIAGDWNGDGADTIGLYAPLTGSYYLRDALLGGIADQTFTFASAGSTPIAGNWDAL